MKPKFRPFTNKIFPVVTDSDIEAFEKILKYKLPESYKKFLREINGGWAKPEYFRRPLDPTVIENIERFFSLNIHEKIDKSLPNHFMLYKGNLLYEWDCLKASCNMPDFMLRIATTSVPNDFLLSVAEEDYGYIYGGHEELGSEPSYNERRAKRTANEKELRKIGFALIAYDFDDLLNSAIEMTDEEFLNYSPFD
ncbi:MAG: SMI1/KNR4 family protein [Candidatus Sericytochromatia bacterium]|nr:SMI1/KNR4 family protein [Candidatus Sericytochromatia bacterium]